MRHNGKGGVMKDCSKKHGYHAPEDKFCCCLGQPRTNRVLGSEMYSSSVPAPRPNGKHHREGQSLGATFVERGLADATVEHLERFGIVSEVVEEIRFVNDCYWCVKVYPRMPEGTH